MAATKAMQADIAEEFTRYGVTSSQRAGNTGG
jgi:hypothetical protein